MRKIRLGLRIGLEVPAGFPLGSYLFIYFRAAPMAYGVSQARGQIGAVDAGLGHSHSNTRSELRL